jgi:hypothetical protein
MTKEAYEELIQNRKQAFRMGERVPVSSCFLANYFGTPEEAATAVEAAATHVLRAYTGSKEVSLNAREMFRMDDLEKFKNMCDKGMISNMSFFPQDYWTKERKEAHSTKCENGVAARRDAWPRGLPRMLT